MPRSFSSNLSTALFACALFLSSAASAHHGWSRYDSQRPLTLTGTIVAMSYEQPHGTIEIEAEKKRWEVILAPPTRMQSRGLTREMLDSGTPVSVAGFPHRTDSDEMRAESITVAGKTIQLR